MAYCPNISDEQVVKEFNSIVTHFGGKPLSIEEFKDISLRDSREGIDKKAMESAYYLWNKYAGNLVAIQNDGNYKSTQIKKGVSELFESNPELANQVYEALGFKQTITQDDKSYYRGQIEKPTIDEDGNLVLYGREDELYKRAGLKSKGTSMTDNLQSAIEYGNGQLEVAQNLASETYDVDRELERLSENGYYLIQIPKNVSNEVVKEAGEVKVIGDKIIIPKGQYKIEQVVDDVEQITPQQKQQAQQIYSEYLNTIFPDYIDNFAYEGVEEFLVVHKIIDRKC